MDDFSLLGISPGSSAAEIRRAWHKLVRNTHPDHAKDPEKAGAQLAEINAAFDRVSSGNPRITKFSPSRNFDQEPTGREAAGADQAHHGGATSDRDQRPRSPRSNPGREQTGSKTSGWGLKRPNQDREPRQTSSSSAPASPSTLKQDIRMSPVQRRVLNQALDTFKRQEATRRVINERGAYPDPRRPINTERGDMPGFHAPDRISVENNIVRIHMTSELKPGRNFVAFPALSKANNGQIRPGTDIDTLWFKTDASGRGRIRLDESRSSVAGGKGVAVELCFGEAPSRSRSWRETAGAR